MSFVSKAKRQVQMSFVSKAKRQVQMSFVSKAKRQIQKSPTSIDDEMNEGLSYFSAGVQTPAEIEELSLRTPRPVATTE
ncbi:hypothetical protein [Lysinibacillus sp. JNUCC 51]|uniref:hypothetical protein n=1 Tax=Lysinibacillus sp. JNUCC-51 TaxID=2792479 RepID=UPI00193538CE|nr:hypothetical protein JNUCC51_05125 [Lysinibacillus sp. JNUCC-51]